MVDSQHLRYGVLVWITYPFVDQPARMATRPALIVSNDSFNDLHTQKQIVFAPITSQVREENDFRVKLEEGTEAFEPSRLKKTSYIKLDMMMVLDESLVLGYLGHLPLNFMKREIAPRCKSIF